MSEIALVARLFGAWPLSEIKALSLRERRHWINVGLWNLRKLGG